MGQPLFKIQKLVQVHNVHVFSSNYCLYGDLSSRVMSVLGQYTPSLEIYSIDEAFLDLSGFSHRNLIEHCLQIRSRVKRWTGIPVSIGVGSTKTLAKIANQLAKKHPEACGVWDLTPTSKQAMLSLIDVADVWGIGRQYTKLLRAHGIENALQLRDANRVWIKRSMGVIGLRIVLELGGVSCMPIELCPQQKKTMCVSRSFGRPVESLPELKEAVATYTSRAADTNLGSKRQLSNEGSKSSKPTF